MRVKPAEGRAVRDPLTNQLLPPDGRDVPLDVFWRRRLRDGDVVPTESGAAPALAARTRSPAREP